MIVESMDVYETILHSDIHVTAYSSCALEAPALGVPNVLVNIENKAYEYYRDILSDKTTSYVSTTDEFIKLVSNLPMESAENIQSYHKDVMKPNYEQNIDAFLKKLMC